MRSNYLTSPREVLERMLEKIQASLNPFHMSWTVSKTRSTQPRIENLREVTKEAKVRQRSTMDRIRKLENEVRETMAVNMQSKKIWLSTTKNRQSGAAQTGEGKDGARKERNAAL